MDFKLLIDGKECAGRDDNWQEVLNPATGEVIGRVAHATQEDLDRALEAAALGFTQWSAVSNWERGSILKRGAELMRERVDDLARMLTLEMGKPLREAKAEVNRSADFIEWAGEQARRITDIAMQGRELGHRITIETHPAGVVAAFTPWNFPMAQAAKKFAGALGAGCSIICKAPEETPASVLGMAHALLDAGVPPAAIAVVYGVPADISSYLIPAPAVAKVTFTGSIPVGKLLAAQAGRAMKPVTMELGGHAPVIICKDTDPERLADYLVKGKYANAGQICMSPTRFFVEEEVYEPFVDRFIKKAAELRVGPGTDETTEMGPLLSERRLEAISDLVTDATKRGATLRLGGQRIGNKGSFYAPTVLTDIPPDARVLHEEPFGPIAAIQKFSDEEKMLTLANGLEFGLSSYVFTNDSERQRRLAQALKYGVVGVNDLPAHMPEIPLGGWKESGFGTEGGQSILEPFQKTRFVSYRG
ncbi:NAD-dependent succinate-semialdehyde dehydrogenase [Celeribacter halophilus]|uniref:NAD-dependent succinate-semialdehyde dehydrogenase n=1 Tax=Celeribacter halophilus TaxID=576117 RepID=UPI0026E1757A|nr:NAD-dependent succinate-semialdehyde dehydrogenase [Celeribacter halophilus]MDO6725114.1 NAD-dependent succinate-semialdehyde dehydrogenase [Celeribacter halophilus]